MRTVSSAAVSTPPSVMHAAMASLLAIDRRWRRSGTITFLPPRARTSSAINVRSSIVRLLECLVQRVGAQIADDGVALLGDVGPGLSAPRCLRQRWPPAPLPALAALLLLACGRRWS